MKIRRKSFFSNLRRKSTSFKVAVLYLVLALVIFLGGIVMIVSLSDLYGRGGFVVETTEHLRATMYLSAVSILAGCLFLAAGLLFGFSLFLFIQDHESRISLLEKER